MLFTFPSRYWYTIGLTGVFSLTGWSRRIHAGFLVPRATQDTARRDDSTNTGLSPSTVGLSRPLPLVSSACHAAVLLPRRCRNTRGLGWSPFARHYWGNHCCFLFLQVLRCFSSLRWPHAHARCRARSPAGCPIRKSRGQGSFAPYPGLSQLITSFIASVSQGIRPAPFPFFVQYLILSAEKILQ